MDNSRQERRRRRRDRRRQNRRIKAPKHFNTVLRHIVGPTLKWLFHIEYQNRELVNTLKPPYVVLPNHGCVLDPFMVNSYLPAPIHYVVSDSNFRSKLVDFGLSLVGSIPKTKALSDLETVKNIVKIKAHNGIIGIFPEGQSTWDGSTLPLFYSTAKLLKSLKVPVVTVNVKGAFLSLPRWARGIRRGKVTITFSLGFTPEQLKAMSVEEIFEGMKEQLSRNEFDVQRSRMVRFLGKNKANYLEIVLFVCPNCHSMNTLHSQGDYLTCTSCGYRVKYNSFGFFEPLNGSRHFEDLRQWNLWQTEYLEKLIDSRIAETSPEPLFSDDNAKLFTGYKSLPLEKYGTGRITLYTDRIEFTAADGSADLIFPHARIEGINVQNSEHLEFYLADTLYRLTLKSRRGNTYKWNAAVRHIQGRGRPIVREPAV